MKVPHDCGLVSFDVTSLFTNVPLEYTIDVIHHKVYEERFIKTDIPKKEMKELLLLCTKNVHFEFNGETFPATVLPWAPPLGPVIAGIFMVELENTLVSRLKNYLLF